MITPPRSPDSIREVASELKSVLPLLFCRYLPGLGRVPLHQGVAFVPAWKVLPTSKIVHSVLVNRLKVSWDAAKSVKTCFISLPYGLAGWTSLVEFVHARGEQWSQGILWPKRVRFAFDKNKKLFSGVDLDWFERCIGPYLPTCEQLGIPPATGRLSFSFPGAGKRRIFAIGNYANQRLLRPVHDWAMAVLKSIPMDGTFNQTKPLDRFVGRIKCFSYDLTAPIGGL